MIGVNMLLNGQSFVHLTIYDYGNEKSWLLNIFLISLKYNFCFQISYLYTEKRIANNLLNNVQDACTV
jgi:hypothetical protein